MRYVIGFAIFLIPFLLRLLTGFEPYPALLLPDGAKRAHVYDDTIPINSRRLYAVDQTGAQKEITGGDATLLPPNIPRKYGIFLVELAYRDQILALNDAGLERRIEGQRRTLRAWLQAAGFPATDTLLVVEQPARLNLRTGAVIHEGSATTKSIQLR
ncbi:MAG: hypothetical protein ACKOU6_13410 [Planctomycetota bacterium]